jgi:hypothetical protein
MAANKTAYVFNINPNSHSQQEVVAGSSGVHQTSPAWVLTFLRWAIRDTLRTTPTPTVGYSTIIGSSPDGSPLVVENDCVQVSVADSKSVLTPSMTATLVVTDVNYETELAPGDFVFVNMLNWETDARRVANQARNQQPINGIHDGFKGFFKVQSVRKSLEVDPSSGIKRLFIKITGFAFTEFNNSIYFNPALINNTTDQNLQLYLTNIKNNWDQLQTEKGLSDIQGIVQFLISSFVGSGFPNNDRKANAISPITPNTHFLMPNGVGNLLGINYLVEAAEDVYNYIFGIQEYAAQAQTLAQGMNCLGVLPTAESNSRFVILPNHVEGTSFTKPEYWNQVKAWSILNQFTNAPLNELYTCFRVSPDNSVMPTMVFRQIPFTNDDFQTATGVNVTRFMNLPRWNISPALALNFDLGRDEALRLNFMQYYGIPVNSPNSSMAISIETSKRNYVYDVEDVIRNGLRPAVITSDFDYLLKDGSYKAPNWAKIMGDALIGGHLKMSGTINFVGIPEPIAVGDNLQFDGVVYHIEQTTHNAAINPKDGKKMFRTAVVLSNGLSIQSNFSNVDYAEMKNGGAYDKRAADYNQSQILPGISESQDTIYRKNNPDTPHSEGQSFVQPNTSTSIRKSTRDT